MASPFTELECYIILFSLFIFSLFTLHGMIHERCAASTGRMTQDYLNFPETKQNVSIKPLSAMEIPFSGFELVFIILAFTVFCVFGLAAVYTRTWHADNQGESAPIQQNTSRRKSRRNKESRNSHLQEN